MSPGDGNLLGDEPERYLAAIEAFREELHRDPVWAPEWSHYTVAPGLMYVDGIIGPVVSLDGTA